MGKGFNQSPTPPLFFLSSGLKSDRLSPPQRIQEVNVCTTNLLILDLLLLSSMRVVNVGSRYGSVSSDVTYGLHGKM